MAHVEAAPAPGRLQSLQQMGSPQSTGSPQDRLPSSTGTKSPHLQGRIIPGHGTRLTQSTGLRSHSVRPCLSGISCVFWKSQEERAGRNKCPLAQGEAGGRWPQGKPHKLFMPFWPFTSQHNPLPTLPLSFDGSRVSPSSLLLQKPGDPQHFGNHSGATCD